MKSFRNIRVIPVVLVAVAGLAMLKVAGLVLNGGYVFDYQPNPTRKSWAEENLNFPTGREDPDITGSTHGAPKEAPKPAAPETKPEGTAVKLEENQAPVSASERAILERLQARRQEIESRQREIDIRESLLKSAEKRIESKVEEMKAVESRISATAAEQKAAEAQRMKGLVTMYEGMKPKDAARVFDRLEMSVLIEIASQIAPRKMSDIMGLMSPEAAERLTVEMARRAGGGDQSASAADLPKIDGKPTQKPN
ncbi:MULTISPECIES: flagellar protein FlbB [unclassified Bradyrhizobium]|uniref:MotE family protein n=1 Tax=unclassified Bradyrhizobium TaxID=2631580 RepID=UPI002478A364|nr:MULTISPECIES: flagellar protein FlbB [unclassified Bradyrhizobium]WGR74042.1 flagellar protein FlbB [Bradyrhizobium sp. ISRA426]WGR78877.1 flagellar protein FlbB [Bradyrhizobium sp. ISRA430]WGR89281.1 flagellar protein FlbB [Bradyrhizobium sp. ISRA432]